MGRDAKAEVRTPPDAGDDGNEGRDDGNEGRDDGKTPAVGADGRVNGNDGKAEGTGAIGAAVAGTAPPKRFAVN